MPGVVPGIFVDTDARAGTALGAFVQACLRCGTTVADPGNLTQLIDSGAGIADCKLPGAGTDRSGGVALKTSVAAKRASGFGAA